MSRRVGRWRWFRLLPVTVVMHCVLRLVPFTKFLCDNTFSHTHTHAIHIHIEIQSLQSSKMDMDHLIG
jgi:hypothetical protein